MVIERDMFLIVDEKNNDYVMDLVKHLEENIRNIMYFFDLSSLKQKKKIIIWNDLELYKEHIEQYYEYHDYMCADTNDGNINILSLDEAHKTKEHCNMTLEEMRDVVCHEFVHICQQDCELEGLDNDLVWFWEALATNLGNPDQFRLIELDIDIGDLEDFNNLSNNYLIAFTIGKYLLENYSRDEILEYVRHPKSLLRDGKTILEGAINWSKSKNFKK